MNGFLRLRPHLRVIDIARIILKSSDNITLQLSKLGAASGEIARKAIHAGAGIMADQIRRNLKNNLKGSENSSGDLLNSLGITPIRRDSEGDWSAKVGFDGYDKKGVPNQLKARVMESGSSKQQKKPFIRPAVNQVKQKATDEMERIIIEEAQNIMGGK